MDNERFKQLYEKVLKGEEVPPDELYEALVHDAEKRQGDLRARREVVNDLSLDDIVDGEKPKDGLI